VRIEHEQLRQALLKQEQRVAVYNRSGIVTAHISSQEALPLVGAYFGIGNRQFVRHLRPYMEAATSPGWLGGSRTTHTIRGAGFDGYARGKGQLLGSPKSHQEHNPLPNYPD